MGTWALPSAAKAQLSMEVFSSPHPQGTEHRFIQLSYWPVKSSIPAPPQKRRLNGHSICDPKVNGLKLQIHINPPFSSAISGLAPLEVRADWPPLLCARPTREPRPHNATSLVSGAKHRIYIGAAHWCGDFYICFHQILPIFSQTWYTYTYIYTYICI